MNSNITNPTTIASFTEEHARKIPPEMAGLHCFHLWKKVMVANGKVTKVPVDRQGKTTNHMDTTIHMDLDEAVKLSIASDEKYGVALSLSKDGTLIEHGGKWLYLETFDYDGFAQKHGEGLDGESVPLLKLINSYTELSDSTTGFKTFYLTDRKPATGTKAHFGDSKFASQFPEVKKYTAREIEAFSHSRFLALTGNPLYKEHFKALRFIPEAELVKIEAEIDKLAKTSGGSGWEKKAKKPEAGSEGIAKTAYARISEKSLIEVLRHIDHHDEQLWSDTANVLARVYGECGREIFHHFSSGTLANDPYSDYSEEESNARFERALREVTSRPDGYGVTHLIELAKTNPHCPSDLTLEFEESETNALTLIGKGTPEEYAIALDLSTPKGEPNNIPLVDLFGDEMLRQEDVDAMADAEIIFPDLIVKGHVQAIVSPANGGKTTIMIYVCEKLVAAGMDVYYINVDGSPGDLKRHFAHANEHGYKVLAPDARQGGSIQSVHNKLHTLLDANIKLCNTVFVFDTLKKFVQVIDKSKAAAFYKTTRALSVKGATITLLGHTNKHAGEDGQQVFEGTADLRNDVDELIYLDCYKNEADGVLEVTTRPDKVRADLKPKTFIIDLKNDRTVSELGYTKNIIAKEERQVLELFKAGIISGLHSQKDLLDYAEPKTTEGKQKLRKMLIKFTQWESPEIVGTSTGRGKDMHYALANA